MATPLTIINDQYDGVIIDGSDLPQSLEEFEEELLYLIKHLLDKNLLWIKLDIENSTYIPLLTKHDFIFHHCNERDITLVKKLIPNPIIPTAKNHTLGVGAIVFDNKKLLVVKDRIWKKYKLPGGHIDDNENISSALVREVYEETGVKVEFDSIVSLGHFSPGQFDESNLYIVCKAWAKSYEIDVKDTSEIIEARWIKVEEFLNDEEVHPYNKSLVKNSLNERYLSKNFNQNIIFKDDITYELFG